jgi:hypothetical protein
VQCVLIGPKLVEFDVVDMNYCVAEMSRSFKVGMKAENLTMWRGAFWARLGGMCCVAGLHAQKQQPRVGVMLEVQKGMNDGCLRADGQPPPYDRCVAIAGA